MSFFDILQLAFRNLRQAKLRALLTTMGVVVGVAVIVTMVSFGLGLQQNMLARFGALDLFNEITVFGRSLTNLATAGFDRQTGRTNEGGERRGPRLKPDKNPTRILDDAAIAEIAKIPGVAYVQPTISLYVYTRANGHVRFEPASGASVPNGSSRFKTFLAGGMISSPDAPEAVVTDTFTEDFGFEKPEAALGQTIEFLAPPADSKEKSSNEKSKNQNSPSDEGPARPPSERRARTGRYGWSPARRSDLCSRARGTPVVAGTSWPNEPGGAGAGTPIGIFERERS